MAIAVGIDLGTTNTVIAAVREGVAATVTGPEGRRLIPSTVSFLPSGATLVGLGEIELSGIAPAPRGEARIAVTFVIDPDGILDVRARDVKTGRETAVRLQLAGGQGAAGEPSELEALRQRQAAHPSAPLDTLR
jgi:molecular chaperone DnaK (HSP70)